MAEGGHDTAHDPGPAAAGERAARVPVPEATIVRPPSGGALRVGTAGWTDPTLTAAGVFYPAGADTPDERLRYYASRFPVVEIDSPYYALPTRRAAELWVERTPPDFTFHVKANALMTGHPTEVRRLPKALRDELPKELQERERIYAADLPPPLVDAVWAWFVDALAPLHAAGKLGAIVLQYPRWFVPSRASADALLDAKRRLGDYLPAIEFRQHRWLTGRIGERTLDFLSQHDLPLVMVDGPQGHPSSMPPLAAVTSRRLALLRLHGRRADTWEKRGASVAEKYRYLYDTDELGGWVSPLLDAARTSRETHVIQNNCYANYGTTNALELTRLLLAGAVGNPDTTGDTPGPAGSA